MIDRVDIACESANETGLVRYHVYPVGGKSHEMDGSCWCEPSCNASYEDEAEVWVHPRFE